MNTNDTIKSTVREKYAAIALQSQEQNAQSCCGSGPQGTYTIMSESYAHLKGYNPAADLSLGCGLPTEFAAISDGHTVLDLGSGAGNDCFIARAETGPTGKVIGVDFTPEMIEKARNNADKMGFNNVEFRQGDIEALPVADNSVDVVVSNCVLNLVPNKPGVFREIMRVLRPGGHFSISDITLTGQIPLPLQQSAEMYAGCVAGAIQLEDYLAHINAAGFEGITVQKQKPILIPDEILMEYLSKAEVEAYVAEGTGIFSVTVFARKPDGKGADFTNKPKINLADLPAGGCGPGSGCC